MKRTSAPKSILSKAAVSVTVLLLCIPANHLVDAHARGYSRGAANQSFSQHENSPLEGYDERPRQLMDQGGNDGGGGGDSLIENHDCAAFGTISDQVRLHPEGDRACDANDCGGGCCRIFAWLVCDTSNEFTRLPCVCNENTRTRSPTQKPTERPTPAPTKSVPPTSAPSDIASGMPTGKPSPSPTASPTKSFPPTPSPTTSAPTLSETNKPTTVPTDNPTTQPTNQPTDSPTAFPSTSPTLSPSVSPSSPPTDNPTDSPSVPPTDGPTTSPSTSPTDLPTTSPSANPSPRPSVPPSPSPSDSPTELPFSTGDETNEAGDPVLASRCLEPPTQTQFVQSGTYSYTYELVVPANVDAASVVDEYLADAIHDSVARQFLKCNFDGGDELWVIQSSPQTVDTSQTCAGSTEGGNTCSVVVATDTIFVWDDPAQRRLQVAESVSDFISDINTFVYTEMQTGAYSDSRPDIVSTVYNVDGSIPIVTMAPSPAPVAQTTGGSPTPGGGSGGTSGLNNQAARDGGLTRDGISTPVLVLVCMAGIAIVVVVVMIIVSSNRNRQRQLDYLEKADLDLVDPASTMEEHVEIDSVGGEHVIGTHNQATGGFKDYQEDPYTSPTNRSPRAPLHSQDELDHVVGGHRGFSDEQLAQGGRFRRYRSNDTVNL